MCFIKLGMVFEGLCQNAFALIFSLLSIVEIILHYAPETNSIKIVTLANFLSHFLFKLVLSD